MAEGTPSRRDQGRQAERRLSGPHARHDEVQAPHLDHPTRSALSPVWGRDRRARGEGDDLTDAGVKPLAHPVRPGPGGGHAPPDGGRHPRRPPRAAPPHPPRDGRQGEHSAGPGGRRGPIACRFPASRPRAAEAGGYAGVYPLDAEDPPTMCAMLAAGAALTLSSCPWPSLASSRPVAGRGSAPPRRSGPGSWTATPDSSATPPGVPVTPDLRGRGRSHHDPAEDGAREPPEPLQLVPPSAGQDQALARDRRVSEVRPGRPGPPPGDPRGCLEPVSMAVSAVGPDGSRDAANHSPALPRSSTRTAPRAPSGTLRGRTSVRTGAVGRSGARQGPPRRKGLNRRPGRRR